MLLFLIQGRKKPKPHSVAATAPAIPAASLSQLVVLTPYLAQLREIRDEIGGTVSAQDSSDLAEAIRLGDGNNDQGRGKPGKNGSPGGGGKGGGSMGGGVGVGGVPSFSRKSVRVATGEGLMVTVCALSVTIPDIKKNSVEVKASPTVSLTCPRMPPSCVIVSGKTVDLKP